MGRYKNTGYMEVCSVAGCNFKARVKGMCTQCDANVRRKASRHSKQGGKYYVPSGKHNWDLQRALRKMGEQNGKV